MALIIPLEVRLGLEPAFQAAGRVRSKTDPTGGLNNLRGRHGA